MSIPVLEKAKSGIIIKLLIKLKYLLILYEVEKFFLEDLVGIVVAKRIPLKVE